MRTPYNRAAGDPLFRCFSESVYGNSALPPSSPAVEIQTDPRDRLELRSTVRKMFELMYEAKGIGLAANQVGLPWRLFIINLTGEATEDG